MSDSNRAKGCVMKNTKKQSDFFQQLSDQAVGLLKNPDLSGFIYLNNETK